MHSFSYDLTCFVLWCRHLQADSWKIISAADDKTLKVQCNLSYMDPKLTSMNMVGGTRFNLHENT